MTVSRRALLPIFSSRVTIAVFVFALSSCFLRSGASRLISAHDAAGVSRIEIASPRLGYPIILERCNETWVLSVGDNARFPANEQRVARALRALAESRAIDPVHGTPVSYGIEQALSTRVTVKDSSGKVLLDITEGTASVTESFRYYLDSRTSKLFRTVPFDELTETRTAYWANLSPFNGFLAGREIERIRCRRGNDSRVLTRGTGADDEKEVDRFSEALTSLNCVDVTNLPVIPSEFIDLWLSDLAVITLKIARLEGGYAAIGFSEKDGMWILTATALESLVNLPD